MTPITGVTARRISLLLANGVSLYAAHLPLDCHPQVGNNAQLARLLDIKDTASFGLYHGIKIGLHGRPARRISSTGFVNKSRRLLESSVTFFPFGPDRICKLGIVSGGGAFLVQEATDLGCDALLTGETSHTAYHTARESGINLICAGHYATEKPGIRALGSLLSDELEMPVTFIDIPTGL
jgi:dinuclear metal center YbgI/SA1388 family protein